MIHFDKNTRKIWNDNGTNEISLFFYESGCAGTKIRVELGKKDGLNASRLQDGIILYMRENEVHLLEESHITHTKGNTWIFTSQSINTRCGCGSSFSLKTENPLQDKIARMKLAIKQKKEGIHK